jgi:hypothetical protein
MMARVPIGRSARVEADMGQGRWGRGFGKEDS